MQDDIERILIPQRQIARRVRDLAEQITADHAASPDSSGAEITIVPVLTGAMIFCSDLIRHIPIAMRIGLVTVSSYPGATVSAQGAQVLSRQLGDVSRRHVLLLDDILDSGGTVNLVAPLIRGSGRPASAPAFCSARTAPRRGRRTSITSDSKSPTSLSSATGWISITTIGTCPTSLP